MNPQPSALPLPATVLALRALALALLSFAAHGALGAEDRLKAGQEGKLEIPGCAFPCVLSIPSDYTEGSSLPLILFMHGSGGTPTSWPWKDATGDKGYLICGLSYGAIANGGAQGIQSDPATCEAMAAFIDKAREQISRTYGIDQKRVILSGLSMGGWATNFYGLRKESKGRYAAYAIMAAGARTDGGIDLSVTKGLPVLVLNGKDDPNLPVANAGMPALEAAGAIATQVVLPNQPHVPSQASMNGPLKDWLEAVDKAAARGKALAAVQWQKGELSGAPDKGADNAALGRFLAGQAFVTAADAALPVLIFIRSRQTGPGDVPSPQAKDSAAVDDAAFGYPGASATPAASRHFTCVDIDVSALDAKHDALLNQGTAPQVILLAKDRSVAAVLKGRSKLTDAALATEMRKLLGADELTATDARVAELVPVLKELQGLQKKMRAKDETIAKIRQMPASDPASRKAKDDRIAQESKALAELDAQCAALSDKLAAPGG